MKVVQIMPEFGVAGAEVMAENLVYALLDLGVEVVIVSLYDFHSAITDRLEARGIKIHYLSKKTGLDLSQIYKIFKVLKQEKADVIHTHRYVMQYAIPAAILAGVKRRIHTVHNIAKKENGGVQRKLNKILYRFFNVTPVAISPIVRKTIVEEYGINENLIPVIYNGEDLSAFKRKEFYAVNKRINLLHIGRFEKQKNHEGLIRAFAKLAKMHDEIELELVGDGKLKFSMEKLVDKLDISGKVKFLGLRNDIPTLLYNADIFLLPSHYEGMPMTLIEAMATGLPIVATNVGGIPDMIVNQKSGLLVNNDLDAIATAISSLVVNQNLRETLGKEAVQSAMNFSSDRMAQKYCKIYEGLTIYG